MGVRVREGGSVVDEVISGLRSFTSHEPLVELPMPNNGGAAKVTVEPSVFDGWLVKARRIISIGLAMSAQPDGFGSKTAGSGDIVSTKGGGRTIAIDDEHGQPDYVPISSTESAALDLFDGKFTPDPVALLAGEIEGQLLKVSGELFNLKGMLERFDRLQSTSKVPDPPMCWVAKDLGLPWDRAWEQWRTTDFAGVLAEPWPEPRPVSNHVYYAVRHRRRLPTRTELLDYLRSLA